MEMINSANGANNGADFDAIVGELGKKEATISLIMNLIRFIFKAVDVTFRVINLVDDTGAANLRSLPTLTIVDWRQIKDALLFILLHFNTFAAAFRIKSYGEVPPELHAYEIEILELSTLHLDIKQSFVDFSAHLTEVLAFILKLIAMNLTAPRNHITGENLRK